MNLSDFRIVRLIPTAGTGSLTRAGPGTYFDKNGVLQTAAQDVPRLTYDPADLSKPPALMLEAAATNYIRNNTMQGAVGGGVGSGGALPTNWSASLNNSGSSGMSCSVVGKGMDEGVDYVDIRFFGTPTLTSDMRLVFETVYAAPATAGETYAASLFAKLIAGKWSGVNHWSVVIDEYSSAGSYLVNSNTRHPFPTDAPLSLQRFTHARTNTNPSTAYVRSYLGLNVTGGQAIDFTLRIGLPQLERDRMTSPIKTSNSAVTRGADVIGPDAGLVYSNVPITEPLWSAGTYAKGTKVRDAAFLVYESLVDGNTAALTDKTKWLSLGITNRWKAFDKAVNSQASAPGLLAFSIKPGTVVNTLMLLNMEGASVTVSQSDSGYVRTRNLVRHDVDNWYDFYYEEPIRTGDAVFDDIPPYPLSLLTVVVDNGVLDAKLGACLVGKSLVLGRATASFSAGVLSYSTSTTDDFGDIRMVKRYNAPRMNFDVLIPAGYEDEAYRVLRQYTDVEIGVIVGDRFSMGVGYGFLGQWDVPKSGGGRTAPIEFKGLV